MVIQSKDWKFKNIPIPKVVQNSPKHMWFVSKTAGLVFYSGCIKYAPIPVHVPSLSGFVTLGGRGTDDSCVMFYWERWTEWVPGLPSDSRIRKRRCVSSDCSTGRKGSWSHTSSVLFPAGSLAPHGEQGHLPGELTWLPSLWCLSSDKLAPRADGYFHDGS